MAANSVTAALRLLGDEVKVFESDRYSTPGAPNRPYSNPAITSAMDSPRRAFFTAA